MKYSAPIFALSTLLLLFPFVAFGADGFVPLTSLPGLSDVASANNIAGFLNQIYKISIGAAAVLAVLQITRAGLMYMTEESIAEKKEARNIIQLSILGLVLVLSPAIVFGLIDPRILDLNVDVSGLQPGATTSTDAATAAKCANHGTTDGSVVQPDFQECCAAHGLYPVAQSSSSAFVCRATAPEQATAGIGQDSNGNYYIHVQTAANTIGVLRMNSNINQSCIQVAYGGFETQDACTAAEAAHQTSHPDWVSTGVCQQESGALRSIFGANKPFCENIETIE